MARRAESKTSHSTVVNTGQAGVRYRQEALESFYDGFKAAGIDFAVFLPDSMLDGIEQLIIERGGLDTLLSDYVVAPFLRFFRWLDAKEHAWTDFLSAQESRESDPIQPYPGPIEELS